MSQSHINCVNVANLTKYKKMQLGSCQVGGGGTAPPPVKVEPAKVEGGKEETSNNQPPTAAQVVVKSPKYHLKI